MKHLDSSPLAMEATSISFRGHGSPLPFTLMKLQVFIPSRPQTHTWRLVPQGAWWVACKSSALRLNSWSSTRISV